MGAGDMGPLQEVGRLLRSKTRNTSTRPPRRSCSLDAQADVACQAHIASNAKKYATAIVKKLGASTICALRSVDADDLEGYSGILPIPARRLAGYFAHGRRDQGRTVDAAQAVDSGPRSASSQGVKQGAVQPEAAEEAAVADRVSRV